MSVAILKTGVMTLLLVVLSACTAIHPPEAYLPSRNGIVAGETITVQPNENIYTIAHEHNVSMRELIVLNDLKPPFEIKPGRSLTLPATGSSFGGDMKPPAPAPLDTVEKSSLAPIEPAAVTSQPLELVPAAPAPVPAPPAAASGPQSSLNAAPRAAMMLPPPAAAPKPAAASAASEPVRLLNQPTQPQQQMATTMTSPSAVAGDAADGLDMKWPVQGPILSAFGSKGAGLMNDGVNIGAPKGAPVTASAPGTVVYAGNEMKGFGNLVLIRHQGEWVTAYAHLERVLVKKDSVVAQGDMIGTVGKSGNVSSPQLHFEVRHNGKAVDPAGVIKGG